MNFLTDVKTERFACSYCHQFAKIVVVENDELAWCDTFECSNTSTMVKLDGEWQEYGHEEIFDIGLIQGLIFKKFMLECKTPFMEARQEFSR